MPDIMRMLAIQKRTAILKIPASEYKMPPFPINDIKMPADEQIPVNNQKRK